MRQMFNYNHGTEDFDVVVNKMIDSARLDFEGKRPENYADIVKTTNEAICELAVKGTRWEQSYAEKGLDLFKNPQVYGATSVHENYDAVLAQVINAITPEVVSARYASTLAEVVQVGFGDTARFVVKSNALFKVNSTATGVARGVLQPVYDTEYTVNAGPITIDASVDWYSVASGSYDYGDFAIKAAKSFEAYIFLKMIAAMTSATSQMGAAYSTTGFTTNNWITMAQRVSAVNGGAKVYAMGTLAALSQALPSNVGLQYGLGEQIMEKGCLNKYLGIELVPMDNALVPGTTNSTAALAVPDNLIYMVATDSDRPVKVVFEGDSVTIESDSTHNSDRTYRFTITMRVGLSAITGSKFGTITVA